MALSLSNKIRHTMYFLSSARKYRRTEAFSIRRRSIPVPVLCYITSGKGNVNINGTLRTFEPQQLWFLPPGSHLEASAPAQDIEYFVIVIEGVHAVKQKGKWITSPAPASPPLFPPGRLPLRDPQEAGRKIEQLYAAIQVNKEQQEPPEASYRRADLQLQSLLELLLHPGSVQETEQPADQGIGTCIAYMHEHYHEKIGRQTLAELAKLTPNAFCRSFKRTTGLSPTDYLNRIRIDQAKTLLSPDTSVKDVAVTVGYGSEYYFSRIFKETVGFSPSLYIRRERLKVATASRCGFHENLSSIGMEAAAAVDCYRYPWMDDAEYDRQLLSQMEQLRLVKPDLIIADYAHRSCYESFKQIAPTVMLEHHLDWRVTHRKIAGLVGRETEAEHTLGQLQVKAAGARERLVMSTTANRVAVIQLLPQRIRIQGTINHPLNELIYDELGLNPGEGVPLNKMREELLSGELPMLEADYMFIIKQNDPPQAESSLSRIQLNASSRSNPSAADRTIRYIPNWLVMSWTPQGRSRIIDEITDILLPVPRNTAITTELPSA